MSPANYDDGDANAQAMAEVHAKREAKLKKPVKITTGLRDDVLAALRASNEFLERFTGPKKPHGERVPAQRLAAQNAALIKQLETQSATAVRERAGRRAQSSAQSKPKGRARD